MRLLNDTAEILDFSHFKRQLRREAPAAPVAPTLLDPSAPSFMWVPMWVLVPVATPPGAPTQH